MKRVKIDKFDRPNHKTSRLKDKLYSVRLGNGEIELFTSEKATRSFLAQTNKRLSEITFELNEIYIDVFRYYRQCYFHVESKKIPVLIAGIDKAFFLTLTRSDYTNGNYFVFSHLKNIAEALHQVCSILLRLNREKKYFTTVHFIKLLMKRLNDLLPELQNNK